MKMSKTKLTCWALLGLSIVGLAACNRDGTSSSSEELGDRRLNITLAASSIPEGSTFFDGCLPSVVFEDLTDGTTREVYNYSARTTYTITNDTSGEEYSASDSLPAGQYTCEVRYSQSGYTYGTVKFNVVAETPTVAAEGKGYKSYKVEDLSEYQIQNFDEIETLQKWCTKKVPVKGTREYQTVFDRERFTTEFTLKSIVFPNLDDAELQTNRGVVGAEALLKDLLTPGELADLYLAASEASDFQTGMGDKIKTVKN